MIVVNLICSDQMLKWVSLHESPLDRSILVSCIGCNSCIGQISDQLIAANYLSYLSHWPTENCVRKLFFTHAINECTSPVVQKWAIEQQEALDIADNPWLALVARETRG